MSSTSPPSSSSHWSLPLAAERTARVVVTDRRHGDLGVHGDAATLERRRRAVVDAPWTWFHQRHGADVVTVGHAGDGAGREADAGCTAVAGAPIAVQVADCAPVAFADPAGVIGVAHAGWRGLVAGVLERTVDAMADLGARSPVAVLGPRIGPDHYEFGPDDLDAVAARLGDNVRSITADGAPALDLAAGVVVVLDRLGISVAAQLGGCTAADADRYWSHRARREPERQALVAWIDPA